VNFSSEVSKQLSMKPAALTAAAGIMCFLGFIPGLPFWPFFILAASIGGTARLLTRKEKNEETKKAQTLQQEKLKTSTEKLENLLSVDVLELEVGYGLINIVDSEQNGDLLERISHIRKQFVLDLGVIIPPLRIRDNLELAPADYQILLKGVIVGQGSLMVGSVLAMDPGTVTDPLHGIKTTEPAFGLEALWLSAKQKEEATYRGYTVVDLSTVIATHLTEIIRNNISELLGRQEVQGLIETLKQTAPKVIEDLIPNLLPVSTILKILKNLLKENVPIRDLRTILESLLEIAGYQKDPIILTEYVRSVLSRVITRRIVGSATELSLITLDRSVEETLASSIIHTDQGPLLSADPDFIRHMMTQIHTYVADLTLKTNQAVVLCSPLIRYHLKNLFDRFLPNVTVLSHNEISHHIKVQSFATVRGLDNALT
jgi:flagellar biosynthesis protein FlhA